MIDSKPTNPKDVIGSGKLPLELVPDTAPIYMATSFLEGALKYGRFNWRIAGVRASIYVAAARRHLDKWWNGEDVDKCIDPETGEDTGTGVHHLASVMACCAIILDAELVDKLTDDRPPRADVAKLIASLDATVARLKAMFAEHHPRQYTIADSPDRRESVYNAIADQRPEWVPQTKLERMVFGGTPRTVATLDGCKRCDKPFGQPHEQNCHEAYG
jgi:hypothetical protein